MPLEWGKHLADLGMIRQVSCGIQLDINATIGWEGNKKIIGSLCDHNCTTEYGYYNCPAARSVNPGLEVANLAPSEKIIQGLEIAIAGIKAAVAQFLLEGFGPYTKLFKVPEEVAGVFLSLFQEQKLEVNITGGNPEIHPDILDILSWAAQQHDITTNLTTTGRRFVLDAQFSNLFNNAPPGLLAFSADSFDNAEQLRRLASMSQNELFRAWQDLPSNYGQRQKAIEAIYAAKILKGNPNTEIAFNLVVHPGNIDSIEDIIWALSENFPGSHIFPYPAQCGFNSSASVFTDFSGAEKFVDRMISAHFEDYLPITKRLQYWLILKAVLETYRTKKAFALEMFSGRGLWKCYVKPWIIRYIQIGKPCSPGASDIGGGYLGCFWNSCTITNESKQLWDMGPDEIGYFIYQGATLLASQRNTICPGCGFPRLLFDVVSTEMGLNEAIVPEYLNLRKSYAGY